MTTKTITVTEDAYTTLHRLKQQHESFSDVLLRIGRKRSLSEFIGALSPKSAAELETAIKHRRKQHTASHKQRLQKIINALEH